MSVCACERERKTEAGIALSDSSQCWRIPLQIQAEATQRCQAQHTQVGHTAAEGGQVRRGRCSGVMRPGLFSVSELCHDHAETAKPAQMGCCVVQVEADGPAVGPEGSAGSVPVLWKQKSVKCDIVGMKMRRTATNTAKKKKKKDFILCIFFFLLLICA